MDNTKNIVRVKSFLSAKAARELLLYARKNMDRLAIEDGVPMYSGHLFPISAVDDDAVAKKLKRLLRRTQVRAEALFGAPVVFSPDECTFNRWPAGMGLPTHADNAYEDGSPNYAAERKVSAILYLNENYRGGEIYFVDRETNVVSLVIRPKAGDLILFSSDWDTPHGVALVREGIRWTIPMWFSAEE